MISLSSRLGRATKVLGLMLTVAVAAMMQSQPANAIIGGQNDGSGHPYVGGIDVRPIPNVPIFTVSGVLISPTVLLTAGHTTRRFELAGLTQARVTFDPVASDSSTWYTGTVHTSPDFDPASMTNPGDLGVIVFDTPVPDITPAALPTANLLDQVGAEELRHTTLNVVGYGISRSVGGLNGGGRPGPDPTSTGTRKLAEQTAVSFTEAWLRLRMVGDAEVCIGDSGSPSLVDGSNLIYGITIAEGSLAGRQCRSEPWDVRVDTPSARAFLGKYVALP